MKAPTKQQLRNTITRQQEQIEKFTESLANAQVELLAEKNRGDGFADEIVRLTQSREAAVGTMRLLDNRIAAQRRQITELAEKLEAMKTWRGWVRTAGQKLGLSR